MKTSRTAALWHGWSTGGEVVFRLPIGALEELQDRTGLGPQGLIEALGGDAAEFSDEADPFAAAKALIAKLQGAGGPDQLARTVLTVAARWGGNTPEALQQLKQRIEYSANVTEWPLLAAEVLAVAMRVPEDEPVPKLKSKGPPRPERPEQPGHKLAFGQFYQAAGAMGLAPSELRDMSFWQYQFYKDGWNIAQGGHPGYALTEEQELELDSWMDAWEAEGDVIDPLPETPVHDD
jgi:hypothetical protein